MRGGISLLNFVHSRLLLVWLVYLVSFHNSSKVETSMYQSLFLILIRLFVDVRVSVLCGNLLGHPQEKDIALSHELGASAFVKSSSSSQAPNRSPQGKNWCWCFYCQWVMVSIYFSYLWFPYFYAKSPLNFKGDFIFTLSKILYHTFYLWWSERSFSELRP